MINLVTGATGLVGMHIVLDLLSKNETVKATYTKNSSFETINSLFDFYNKKALLKKIHWLEMDIEDILINNIVSISSKETTGIDYKGTKENTSKLLDLLYSNNILNRVNTKTLNNINTHTHTERDRHTHLHMCG